MKGLPSMEAPFNPALYGAAQISPRSDVTGETRVIEFDGSNQYRLRGEAFPKAVLEQKTQPAFTLDNSPGNQRVIDPILS